MPLLLALDVLPFQAMTPTYGDKPNLLPRPHAITRHEFMREELNQSHSPGHTASHQGSNDNKKIAHEQPSKSHCLQAIVSIYTQDTTVVFWVQH